KSRGSGYANTVTEAGWRGFRMHLKIATEHYKLAVEKDEGNSVALSLLVTIGLGRGQLEGMLPEIVRKGLERTPEDGLLASKISYYLTPRWHGSREQIITFVRDELPKWPNSGGKFSCMLERLSLASEWGNSKFLLSSPAAQAVYEKAVARYKQQWPEGDYVVKKIAKNLTTYKSYSAAIAFCRKHEQDFIKQADYKFYLAKALFFSGKYAEAQGLLHEAVEMGNVDGETYFYLGRAAIRVEDYVTARQAYLKAVELLPVSEIWKRGYAYRDIAMFYSVFSDYKSVKTYAAKATKVDPSQAHSWYLLGFAEYKLGNKKAAKVEFNKAVKLDSKYGAIIRKECPLWKMW
ncbi:MAG: tetratricopeptide repeat protein, partial [Verrucomicrobiales bacterium]|nr:tetratricopeptide repeat protein [Verrucomicrobiales bacterium]